MDGRMDGGGKVRWFEVRLNIFVPEASHIYPFYSMLVYYSYIESDDMYSFICSI